MEREIVASMTISGRGIVEFTAKCKEAEKDGFMVYGNPMMSKDIINQVVVKYKVIEQYK